MKGLPRVIASLALVLGTATPGGGGEVSAPELVPPRIIRTVSGELPATLSPQVPNKGTVELVLSLASDGSLKDVLVIATTHPTLAEIALGTLKEWRYEPATLDGLPVACRLKLTISYDGGPRVVSIVASDTPNLFFDKMAGGYNYRRLVDAAELDEPLNAEQRVSPGFPRAMVDSGILSGSVTLDFYVDEYGRPRIPVVVNATEDWFASAAIEALERWRFSPPRVNGRPVVVRAKQEFIFAYVDPTADETAP